MVQGYYTLDEAARILGMTGEELSQMAQHREVRAFADRGTWRFRTQDIEELARRRGQGSNPDLPLGEAPRPQPHDTPTARTHAEPPDEGVFNFGLGRRPSKSIWVRSWPLNGPARPLPAARAGARAARKMSPPRARRPNPAAIVTYGWFPMAAT